MFCLVLPKSAPIANSLFKQANLGMLHGEVGCSITVWSFKQGSFRRYATSRSLFSASL